MRLSLKDYNGTGREVTGDSRNPIIMVLWEITRDSLNPVVIALSEMKVLLLTSYSETTLTLFDFGLSVYIRCQDLLVGWPSYLQPMSFKG